jgi:hypothetical protein
MTGIRKLLLTIFIRPAVLAVEIGLASFPANINSARIWNIFSDFTFREKISLSSLRVFLVE